MGEWVTYRECKMTDQHHMHNSVTVACQIHEGYGNSVYIGTPKGRRDVDFPFDDYFMALAVLAKTRSPYAKPV